MKLWTNLTTLSQRPDIDKSTWNTLACQLVDICMAHDDHFFAAVKEARPVIDTLNKTFRQYGLPTINTNRKNRAVAKSLSEFAANCGITFKKAAEPA